MIHNRKKTLAIALLLSCVLLSLFFFLFRRDDYFLNKTVRLISTRLTQFEYLSKGRGRRWKFELSKTGYTVLQFNPLLQEFEVFAVHGYPGGTVPEFDRLIIEFQDGGLVRFEADGKELGESAYFILKFRSKDDPGKTRGLIFYGSGIWRGIG